MKSEVLRIFDPIVILGLDKSDNGRKCEKHTHCGLGVLVGDKLKFIRANTVDEGTGEIFENTVIATKVC